MNFHKAEFKIARIDNTVEFVVGWVEETNTYGFHKMMKIGERCGQPRPWKWVVTDLASGMRICEGLTRIACAKWIKENEDKINKIKYTDKYKNWVKTF